MILEWKIEALEVKPDEGTLTDVVVTAHWRCNATQGGATATAYGSCSFAAPDQATFTAYESLTKAQVLGWVWANGVDQAQVEAGVTQQLNQLLNPPVVAKPLPWA